MLANGRDRLRETRTRPWEGPVRDLDASSMRGPGEGRRAEASLGKLASPRRFRL